MTIGEVIAFIKAFGGSGGGSSGGVLVVNFTWNDDSADLDKTWQEIFDAANAGVPVVVKEAYENEVYCNNLLQSVSHQGNYQVDIVNVLPGSSSVQFHFETNAATGYPHMA